MRIALINTDPRTKYYPIALLKIGAWLKSEGHDCQVYENDLPAAGQSDEIWLTTCFTFDIYHALALVKEAKARCDKVKVGGISATLLPQKFERLGADVHRGLLMEAEAFCPDYSLLSEIPDYSITHITRGCIRKCKFCMVTTLEPNFSRRKTWADDLHPGTKKILFFDNNWLAQKKEDLEKDVSDIKRIVKERRISWIDFNQGLDARLLTEAKADLLAGLPLKPVRFAFDNMSEDQHYQKAVTLMAQRGYKDFMTYALYNFQGTPGDFYYRIRESARLSHELGIMVKSFPMRYQPILEVDSARDYTGKYWTTRQKKSVTSILGAASVMGTIPFRIEEFNYWFGRTKEEFLEMSNFPKLRLLLRRKKANLLYDRQAVLAGCAE